MKILINHLKPLDSAGGIGTYGKNIIRNIKEEVFFCTSSKKPSKKIRTIDISGRKVKLIEYKEPWVSKEKKYFWPELHKKNFEKRLKELKKQNINFDLSISLFSFFAMPFYKVFNKPSIYVMPSCRKSYFRSVCKESTTIFRKLGEIQIKDEKEILLNNKIIIVVLSNQVRKLLNREYNNIHAKLITISPGVDSRFYRNKINRLKVEIGKTNILTVSRLSAEKNLVSLLNVARELPRINFRIVGSGEQYECLLNIMKKDNIENVIMKGEKEDPLNYYHTSKIFIMPSKNEAFGLVLLEAMASGLPCIAFRPDGKKIITASDEIIKDKVTGFLVKDEKEMAEKIDLLLSNEKLRQKMGKAARKEAEKYSWEKTAREILSLVKE